MSDTETKKNRLVGLLYFGVIIVLYYAFFKWAFAWTVPFLIGLVLALALNPLIEFLVRKTRMKRGFVCAVLLLVIWAAAGFLLFKLGQAVYVQAKNLLEFISSIDLKTLSETVSGFFGNAVRAEDVENMFSSFFEQGITGAVGAASSLLGTAVDVLVKVPELLLFFVAAVMSSYFFAADLPKIKKTLSRLVPKNRRFDYIETKEFFSGKLLHLLLAYMLIMAITFGELLLGLLLLRVDYAVLIALIVAVLDILPIIGTGTILIPWGIIEIIKANYALGAGILALCAVISVVREVIEPRIVGSRLGLSPLLSLVLMYAGLKLFGVLGMFVVPLTMIYLKFLNDTDRIVLWRSD